MDTVDELMKLWPTVAEFARAIGIKPTHAQTMRVRGRIPVDYWPALVAAASERGIEGVTADALMRLHAPSHPETQHASEPPVRAADIPRPTQPPPSAPAGQGGEDA